MMNDVGFQSAASSPVAAFIHVQRQINAEEANLASSCTCTRLAKLSGTLDSGCQQSYTILFSVRFDERGLYGVV